MEQVPYNDRVMVWPLKEGLQGLDRMGFPATLKAGQKGWMHIDVVDASVRRGEVERMVGQGVGELKEPDYTPVADVPKRRKRGRPSKAEIAAREEAERLARATP